MGGFGRSKDAYWSKQCIVCGKKDNLRQDKICVACHYPQTHTSKAAKAAAEAAMLAEKQEQAKRALKNSSFREQQQAVNVQPTASHELQAHLKKFRCADLADVLVSCGVSTLWELGSVGVEPAIAPTAAGGGREAERGGGEASSSNGENQSNPRGFGRLPKLRGAKKKGPTSAVKSSFLSKKSKSKALTPLEALKAKIDGTKTPLKGLQVSPTQRTYVLIQTAMPDNRQLARSRWSINERLRHISYAHRSQAPLLSDAVRNAAQLIRTTRVVCLVAVRNLESPATSGEGGGANAAPDGGDGDARTDAYGVPLSVAELVWEYAGPRSSCLLWPGPYA